MRYIVQSAVAQMPASVRHRYRHVAVLELDGSLPAGELPRMISTRAKGVASIVWHSGPCATGKTPRCAFAKAEAYARELCDRLNAPPQEGALAC